MPQTPYSSISPQILVQHLEKAHSEMGKIIDSLTHSLISSEVVIGSVSIKPHPQPPVKCHCYIITDKIPLGEKENLTKKEYEDLLEQEKEYDMFIDGVCMCGSKKGTSPGRLRPTAFAILKEYIENPKPMSFSLTFTYIPDRLKRKDSQTVLKYFQEARRIVDVPISRYQWKCFKNLSGKGEDKVIQFAPPVNWKWCLIVPVNWGE